MPPGSPLSVPLSGLINSSTYELGDFGESLSVSELCFLLANGDQYLPASSPRAVMSFPLPGMGHLREFRQQRALLGAPLCSRDSRATPMRQGPSGRQAPAWPQQEWHSPHRPGLQRPSGPPALGGSGAWREQARPVSSHCLCLSLVGAPPAPNPRLRLLAALGLSCRQRHPGRLSSHGQLSFILGGGSQRVKHFPQNVNCVKQNPYL